MLARAAWVLLLAGAGCFADRNARNEVSRLKRQIEDLRRQTDGDRHATHELENRVFILEDRVETAQVAQSRTDQVPRLPTVTKTPTPAALVESEGSVTAEPEPDPDPDPVIEGPPLVIRLHGNKPVPETERLLPERRPTARPAAERLPSEPPDLAAIDEKLPVVPQRRPAAALLSASEPDDAMTAYKNATAALSRHEHQTAIAAFRSFLVRFPVHDYADNAQYWLGETYYDQADYQTAVVEFRAVLKRFPGGNKAPDALLKIGYCLDKLGEAGAAGDALAQVREIYPRTDAARLATKRLDEIRRFTR